MPEKKLYDWLYSRTWLRQKCQYSLSLARPLGARCGPLFLQSGHSHIVAASRAAACCFALSLLGLMRMESKNLDESIGMSDYDNAMRKASSLDIANPSLSMRLFDTPLTMAARGRIAAAMSTQQTVKDTIINKLREAFAPESLNAVHESHLHEDHPGHRPD